MNESELLEIMMLAREGRNLEYKRSAAWQDNDFKTKITKSILAFSNVRDGGKIILGVNQNDDNTFNFIGMDQAHINTYTEDDLQAFVSEYADPYVKLALSRITLDDHRAFLVIEVSEFFQLPVICKRDGQNLRRGAIYSRSYRMPESAEIKNEVEMRELLEIASDKLLKSFIHKLFKSGINVVNHSQDNDTLFNNQAGDLP